MTKMSSLTLKCWHKKYFDICPHLCVILKSHKKLACRPVDAIYDPFHLRCLWFYATVSQESGDQNHKRMLSMSSCTCFFVNLISFLYFCLCNSAYEKWRGPVPRFCAVTASPFISFRLFIIITPSSVGLPYIVGKAFFITVETNTLADLASKSSLERDDDMLGCIGRWLPLNDNYIPVKCIVV